MSTMNFKCMDVWAYSLLFQINIIIIMTITDFTSNEIIAMVKLHGKGSFHEEWYSIYALFIDLKATLGTWTSPYLWRRAAETIREM